MRLLDKKPGFSKKKGEKVTLSFRTNVQVMEALDTLAEHMETTRSEVIVGALEELLNDAVKRGLINHPDAESA